MWRQCQFISGGNPVLSAILLPSANYWNGPKTKLPDCGECVNRSRENSRSKKNKWEILLLMCGRGENMRYSDCSPPRSRAVNEQLGRDSARFPHFWVVSTLKTKVQNVSGLHSVNSWELLWAQKEESCVSWEPTMTTYFERCSLQLRGLGCKLSRSKSSGKSQSISCRLHVCTPQRLQCSSSSSYTPAASGRVFPPQYSFYKLGSFCLWNEVSCWRWVVSRKVRAVVSCILDRGEKPPLPPLCLTITLICGSNPKLWVSSFNLILSPSYSYLILISFTNSEETKA